MFDIGDEISFIVHDSDGDEEMITGQIIEMPSGFLRAKTAFHGNLYVHPDTATLIDNSPCCIAFVTSGGSDHVPGCE